MDAGTPNHAAVGLTVLAKSFWAGPSSGGVMAGAVDNMNKAIEYHPTGSTITSTWRDLIDRTSNSARGMS